MKISRRTDKKREELLFSELFCIVEILFLYFCCTISDCVGMILFQSGNRQLFPRCHVMFDIYISVHSAIYRLLFSVHFLILLQEYTHFSKTFSPKITVGCYFYLLDKQTSNVFKYVQQYIIYIVSFFTFYEAYFAHAKPYKRKVYAPGIN